VYKFIQEVTAAQAFSVHQRAKKFTRDLTLAEAIANLIALSLGVPEQKFPIQLRIPGWPRRSDINCNWSFDQCTACCEALPSDGSL